MKLAMAMTPMTGEEETQRQQELNVWRERKQRVAARGKIFSDLLGVSRKGGLFLLGAAAVFYFVMNSGRFQDVTVQVGHKLTARVNSHSALKQSAEQYENEVDQIAKQ